MLVVIAIISILMTAGSIGLSGMGGKGVTSGVATAESLFDEARTTAESRNLRSCVLVAKQITNNPTDDLKRILVAFEETNADGTPEQTNPNQSPTWVLVEPGSRASRPDVLQRGTEQKGPNRRRRRIPTITLSGGNVKKNYEGEYFIYEFNSQGICSTPGASFVIGNGARNLTKPASVQPPRVMASGKRDFGGFVVWRNGRTSVFRSPDQISQGLPQTGDSF